MRAPSSKRFTTTIATVLLALLAPASLATVPGQISYQGLLLDALGDPKNGMVDMVFSLHDAPSGGTQLWTETHDDVSVLDGVYDVVLGETTPITPSIVTGGALYLEIVVDTETLTPRQPLLAVPYALEAESATTVGGFDAAYITAIIQHVDFDGGDPPADHPDEGLDDVDGDGLPNFLDPDNDDDGFSDVDELVAGTPINLLTPTITSFDPSDAEASITTPVSVFGTFFEPGMTVVFGSESPAPANLTPTSFDVIVGPQPVGTVSVQVTLANGEQDSSPYDFVEHTIAITGLSPLFADASATTLVTISVDNYFPGLQVVFGSETPTPTNVIPGAGHAASFDVTVGPQPAGQVAVVVSLLNGNQDSTTFDFVDQLRPRSVFVTGTFDGNLGGLAGADAECQSRATGAGLSGTFLAWLSDGVTDPDARFDKTGGPFVLTSGVVLATDWADLTDGTLDPSIG